MARPTRMMLFRIGRDLGIWDINALGRAMSGELLTEWAVFYGLERDAEMKALLDADVKGA